MSEADTAIRLALEQEPAAEDMALLGQRLREFNDAQVGPSGYRPLAVFLREESGAVAGGLVGSTSRGWLHIDVLWVREELRGRGFGTALLQEAEREAAARGCAHVLLDTFSFQAPGFYRKQGYAVRAELRDWPPGHSRFFMTKDLAPG
ncbi:MAG TPA: GNAT family N-acetyltransferase [Armatimonadota bacterium]|nr:GNAT family N-acetyltransferase [Armatimonadota bacterium]